MINQLKKKKALWKNRERSENSVNKIGKFLSFISEGKAWLNKLIFSNHQSICNGS